MKLIDKDRHARLLLGKSSEKLLQTTRSLVVQDPYNLLQLVHDFDQQLERAGVVSTFSFGAQSMLVGSVSSYVHDPSRSLLVQVAQQGMMSFGQMLRITAQGEVTHFHPVCSFVLDGALRWCHPSPLFRRSYFEENLGAWDSVRFGADTEILERMLRFEPEKVALLETPVMLQLDRDGSLTRQPDSYIGPQGASRKRLAYRQANLGPVINLAK